MSIEDADFLGSIRVDTLSSNQDQLSFFSTLPAYFLCWFFLSFFTWFSFQCTKANSLKTRRGDCSQLPPQQLLDSFCFIYMFLIFQNFYWDIVGLQCCKALVYNCTVSTVLVSTVQQSEPAIHIHISSLFQISFPFRSPQSRVPYAIQQILISYQFPICEK